MSLFLERHTGSAPDGWDNTVRRLGGAIFHSVAWADYQRMTLGVQPLFLLARDEDGKACAAAVAFLRKSRHAIVAWILRDLILPAHPAVRDGLGGMTAAFVGACETVGRGLGCRRIGIESFMSGTSAYIPSENGYAEAQRFEFSLDLTREADALWRGVRKDQRERIRRLPREGVTLEVGSRFEDLQGLRFVREFTQEKRVQQGQGYELDADDQFYDALYAHLVTRGAARLFLAKRGGEVIAALFFAVFNGRAYSMFSGSSEFGYRIGAQSGLFWTAVEAFKADGFHELNRGGVPASAEHAEDPLHGIYMFKLRLGTTPMVCRSGMKVLSPAKDFLARWRDRVRL